MYIFASNGEMGEPCGMPRRLSRAAVVLVFLPRSSVSSTGHSSHILIRCSTRRSTIRGNIAVHDEEAAYAYLEARIWPKGPVCPRCGHHDRISKMRGQSTRI